MKSFLITLASLACLIMCKPIEAHELNAAESTISFNDRTQSIELVHRFYLHDVNHLVQQYYAKHKNAKDTVNDKYSLFTDYVYSNLKFFKPDGSLFEFSNVGSELDGKYFYIYQEHKAITSSKKISFTVNIETMKNQWLPNYWLFNQESAAKQAKSVVLDKNNLTTNILIQVCA